MYNYMVSSGAAAIVIVICRAVLAGYSSDQVTVKTTMSLDRACPPIDGKSKL